MTHPLDGARAKIRRAWRHFNVLEEKISPFEGRERYRVVKKYQTKFRRFTWQAYHRKSFPREHAGLLIGEMLHNCRCALDYVAWELAELYKGGNRKTQFPIYDKRPRDRNGRLIPWDTLEAIANIDTRAQALMERAQPYHRTNPTMDLLWLLHEMNNTDKHKLLVASAGMVKGIFLRYEPPRVRFGQTGKLYRGPFVDGAVIAELEIKNVRDLAGGETKAKVNVNAKFEFRVTLSGPPIPKDMWVLALPISERIVRRTERIVGLFDRHIQRTYGLPPSRP